MALAPIHDPRAYALLRDPLTLRPIPHRERTVELAVLVGKSDGWRTCTLTDGAALMLAQQLIRAVAQRQGLQAAT